MEKKHLELINKILDFQVVNSEFNINRQVNKKGKRWIINYKFSVLGFEKVFSLTNEGNNHPDGLEFILNGLIKELKN